MSAVHVAVEMELELLVNRLLPRVILGMTFEPCDVPVWEFTTSIMSFIFNHLLGGGGGGGGSHAIWSHSLPLNNVFTNF